VEDANADFQTTPLRNHPKHAISSEKIPFFSRRSLAPSRPLSRWTPLFASNHAFCIRLCVPARFTARFTPIQIISPQLIFTFATFIGVLFWIRVCLSVCMFVSRITRKVTRGFREISRIGRLWTSVELIKLRKRSATYSRYSGYHQFTRQSVMYIDSRCYKVFKEAATFTFMF